jgi:hypothetical protein
MSTRRKRSGYQVGGVPRGKVTIEEVPFGELQGKKPFSQLSPKEQQRFYDAQRAQRDAQAMIEELKRKQQEQQLQARYGVRTARAGGSVKSKVNAAGNYTKPEMRKSLYQQIKSQAVQGTKAGQWSARKAQLLAKQYKAKGGGYRD